MSLTQCEIESFNDLCGAKIANEIPGHELQISYFKTVIGIKGASCSCGKMFRVGRAQNRAGCAYQRLGMKEDWNKHIKAVLAKTEDLKPLGYPSAMTTVLK